MKHSLNTDETAEYLNVAPQTIREWRHKNKGPAYYKIGQRCFYQRKALEQFLIDCGANPDYFENAEAQS